MRTIITHSSKETQKLGQDLARQILNPKRSNLFGLFQLRKIRSLIICLKGDLGSGKTTFTQGLLKGLGIKGPYTSPTFIVLKRYKSKIRNPKSEIRNKSKILNTKYYTLDIYHIDAYRIKSGDLLSLGWEEIIKNPNNIIIIEWADRVKKIIPKKVLWIKLEWISEKERKIIFGK